MVIVGSKEEEERWSNPPLLIKLLWIMGLFGLLSGIANESDKSKEKPTPKETTAVYIVEVRKNSQDKWQEYMVKDTLLGYDPQYVDSGLAQRIIDENRPDLRTDFRRPINMFIDRTRYNKFLVYYVPTQGEKRLERMEKPLIPYAHALAEQKETLLRMMNQYLKNKKT